MEVSSWYGFSFKQVVTLVHRIEQNGVKGLENRPVLGVKDFLTDQQMDKFMGMVLEKSLGDYGINAKNWSSLNILIVINESLEYNFKPSQSYKLIEKMGLRIKKVRGISIMD